MPAWILGNGPTLPSDLSPLRNRFTIGVNRILRSGFTPTVILWADGNIYQVGGEMTEDGKAIDESGALLVCDRSVAQRQHHIGLRTWVGDAALKHESTSKELVLNGNTGCCAARWALAIGCCPVYLLGMSATYDGERTDFYGPNEHHHNRPGDNGTLQVMRRELVRLRKDAGERLYQVPTRNSQLLARLAAEGPDVDQDELRARLRECLTAST